jgi:hypothetical protein
MTNLKQTERGKERNVSYNKQKQQAIPTITVDVEQDRPLYRQANGYRPTREVLPNYLDSNPNDVG